MTFVQGPEIWLKNLGLEVPCVVDKDKPALLDVEHRVFVNYETYFLSSDKAREKFLAEPWRYTGPVTDPSSRQRFVPDAHSLRLEHNGRIFFFRSAETLVAFQGAADSLSVPVVPYAGRM